jgi:hypothetical protein
VRGGRSMGSDAAGMGCSVSLPLEGMDKSTLVHTQIQIIIIHFLLSPILPIPNG